VDYSLFSDERLAELFATGDVAAFEALVHRYSRALFNFAYRTLGDYDLASEVAQDTLVRLYGALPGRKSDLPLRPFIYRIARNRAIDVLRERKALPFSELVRTDEDESPVEAVPDPEPLPAELVERKDLQELLQAAIGALPPRYRQVVALRYSTDMTFAEIAEALDMPENTAKTLFQRAKGMLRAALRGDR
jgi:RNA polymerase sigma-70 factor (ECF subfamily)